MNLKSLGTSSAASTEASKAQDSVDGAIFDTNPGGELSTIINLDHEDDSSSFSSSYSGDLLHFHTANEDEAF